MSSYNIKSKKIGDTYLKADWEKGGGYVLYEFDDFENSDTLDYPKSRRVYSNEKDVIAAFDRREKNLEKNGKAK